MENSKALCEVWAEEEESKNQDDKDESVVGAIKSLIDPNEKTKSGKVLPKAYLKSARELVKTLRESLKEDPKDNAKFRRTADAAKESIREYLSNWRGQQTVTREVYSLMPKRESLKEDLEDNAKFRIGSPFEC